MKLYKSGEPIYLTAKLPDDRSNVFPKCEVYDSSGALLSSHTLSHVSDGFYRKLVTLAVGSYITIYKIYKDVGLTQKDNRYLDSEEFLRVENIQLTTNNKIDECIGQVDDLDAQVS